MTNYNERLDEITIDLWAKYGRPGTMDEFVPEAKQAITSLIKELVAEAKLDENNMYIRESTRHYFPSGPSEPHIPLVQFHERIAELEGEK